MRILKTTALAALAGGALISAPASASPDLVFGDLRIEIRNGDLRVSGYDARHHHGYHYPLPFREVRRILRREGYRGIDLIRERDRVYVVRARDYRGYDVRIRVNKYTGDIRNVRYEESYAASQRDIRQLLRDQGYRNIDFVERRPRYFIAHATGYRGHRIALRIDRITCEVQRLGRL